MSMGAVILAGGTQGSRMSLPNSRILIHQPSGGFQGQAADIQIHAEEILNIRKRLDEIFVDHPAQPIEQVHQDMDRDRYMKPTDAVEYGLIDKIIESH